MSSPPVPLVRRLLTGPWSWRYLGDHARFRYHLQKARRRYDDRDDLIPRAAYVRLALDDVVETLRAEQMTGSPNGAAASTDVLYAAAEYLLVIAARLRGQNVNGSRAR